LSEVAAEPGDDSMALRERERKRERKRRKRRKNGL